MAEQQDRHDEIGAAALPNPETVICWMAPHEAAAEAVEKMLERLPMSAVLAVGISGSDAAPTGLGTASGHLNCNRLRPLELPPGATMAHLANRAVECWPSSDLVIVFPDCVLPDDWLERLRAAVEEESTAATACAVDLSVISSGRDAELHPGRRTDVPPTTTRPGGGIPTPFAARAGAVARGSARLHPRLAAVLPTCVYLSGSAVELLGPLDERLRSSYAAVLDFALSARERGLANLLADDLLVEAPAVDLDQEDLSALTARHRTLMDAASQPPGPALERSLTLASVAGEPVKVTVDARALGPQVGGTRTYLLGLLESLAAGGDVHLRVLIAPDATARTHDLLRRLPMTELLTYEQALERPEPSHVVHRPQQVFSADDLLLLRPLGERLVITHHDLMAYHNPTYSPTVDSWQRFVRTTRQALGAADHVLFFSHHAMADAAREDLVDRSRCTVAHLGIDLAVPSVLSDEGGLGAPIDAPSLAQRQFLLCIGADYQHKNRPFALALFDELRRVHHWPGVLVLAGPHVEHGSSATEEQRIRRQRSIPAGLVIELPAVTDDERAWLMRRAAALLYPTVHEGFGLVPFEAAAFRVPCLFAAQSSLVELLDSDLATIVRWDARRSADRALPLLVDQAVRRSHVERLVSAAERLSWSDCARATVDAYRQAIAAPYKVSSEGAWQALDREAEIVRLSDHAEDLTTRVLRLTQEIDDMGSDALALVGPRPLLSRDDQHALLAVAARPAVRRVAFGTLNSAFRVGRSVRRLAGRPAARDGDSDR